MSGHWVEHSPLAQALGSVKHVCPQPYRCVLSPHVAGKQELLGGRPCWHGSPPSCSHSFLSFRGTAPAHFPLTRRHCRTLAAKRALTLSPPFSMSSVSFEHSTTTSVIRCQPGSVPQPPLHVLQSSLPPLPHSPLNHDHFIPSAVPCTALSHPCSARCIVHFRRRKTILIVFTMHPR